MMPKKQIQKKYQTFKEHFSSQDLLGLAALLFGLFLANTSFEAPKASSNQEDTKAIKKSSLKKKQKLSKASTKK